MEVLDNLIKIIQKHQKTLPNVEPLEVDSEFESVLHDTDDGKLDIKNEMYYCTGLRKVHIEIAKLGNLNIVHCIWYPDPEFDIPIFGVDIVAMKDIVSAAITDISPVDGLDHEIFEDIEYISESFYFPHDRVLPEWGEVFSPYCKFARLTTDKEKKDFCDIVDQYLDIFVGAVWGASRDSSRSEHRYFGQIEYCQHQMKNDKTRNILVNYFGKEWAERYMTEVLFDEP